MFKFTQKVLCIFLFTLLCLAAGSVGAEEEMVWPLRVDLVRYLDDSVGDQEVLGEVSIWNTHWKLKIQVTPTNNRNIKRVGIHIVDSTDRFVEILDKKNQPKLKNYDYVTEYVPAVADHEEEIDLGVLDLCWGVDSEKCPT